MLLISQHQLSATHVHRTSDIHGFHHTDIMQKILLLNLVLPCCLALQGFFAYLENPFSAGLWNCSYNLQTENKKNR